MSKAISEEGKKVERETKDVKENDVEMIEVEKVAKKIAEVLDAFMKQELGNKVTQFNMQGLLQIMLLSLADKGE
jgi:hypothetical protein